MAEVITMLALSPTMEEGTVAEWLKEEGVEVEEGDIIAEIETDKATMEMESFFDGTMLKVLVKAGDTVPVGAPMAVVGEPGEDADAALADAGFGDGGAPSEPASGEDTEPAEPAPDPAAESESKSEPEPEGSGSDAPAAAHRERGRVVASPIARRIAEDEGLSLDAIAGSGPHGRIIKRDVEEALAARSEAPASAASAPASAPAAASAPGGLPPVVGQLPDAGGEPQRMSQMRKTIAKRLTQVWQATPHFYLTIDVDMAAAMSMRKQINAQLADAGEDRKISVNDLIIKACAKALVRYPRMNVAYNGDELVFFDRAHIGVAVAIEDGLITPVVKDAHMKGVTEIAADVRDLAARARDKKLGPDEYSGSTFTISNLGMYGIDHFQAVINPPEAAILAVGAVQQVPVVVDGELAVGTRMKATLSCDHRAVDGAVGAEFLAELRKLLEHPLLILS
jgi:pyruvate dehydrogenase E2 component (dihydrolipoamide acetyltransferase)